MTAKATFIPLTDRRFVTIDCYAEAITVALENNDLDSIVMVDDLPGSVVRVRYTGTEEEHRRVDTAALKRSLLDAGASKVYQITADIVKQDRARVQGVDENLEPAAALDAWIDANAVVDGEGLRELLARYTATT